MTRILHVIDSLDLGGAQTALINLIRYADRTRFRHEVAAMHGRGMFADAFVSLGVPVHSLSALKWPPGYLWNLPKLVRAGRFDAVQFHLFASNWIAKPLAAASGVGVLYSHDQCNDAFRSRSMVFTAIDALTNRLSTRVFAVSQSVADFLRDQERLNRERIVLLPNSVDGDVFRPATSEQRLVARRAFGLPESGVVIGGVGRLVPQKNFASLVAAAGVVLERHPDWTFVLFGSGPDEPMLREMARPLGDAVRFAGTVNDRPAIYHALDVQVLPSRFEGLPLTILEAMASRVPVIASDVDGVREIAANRKHAILVAPDDIAGLADAICLTCLRGPEVERQIDDAAALVSGQFDAKRLSAAMHAWYEKDIPSARS